MPYQSELVPPGLRAAIQPHIRPIDFARGGLFVEVQMIDPSPQTFHWPPLSDITTGTTAGSRATARSRIRPGRMVDLSWAVQLNLFKPSMDLIATSGTEGTAPGGSRGNRVSSVRGITEGTISIGGITQGSGPGALPKGDRIPLTVGTALMHVPAELVIFSPALQFWLALNFEGVQPAYESNDPILVEFFKTDYAASLLAQTIAPLLNQADVGLSPTVALAGSLTPNQLARLQLPALHVQDLLVQDDKGQVLTFCVSLGDDSGGVFNMVRSFLSGRDFAYYVSDKVFSAVLAGLWHANAIYTPIVGDVPVEMPIDSNSDETGTGKARVQVNLSDTLKESSIKASTNNTLGDPLRLVSEQTVQLLALWDPNGKQVTDLGDLAAPAVEPFVLSLQMFDQPVGTQPQLQPALQNLLVAQLLPMYVPLIEQFTIADIGGFTSSTLHALVVRWNLASPLDVIKAPITGVLSNS
ncbi:hypothetical protein [Ktedonobacter sp. SOSP1-85]|uniref:hypothetical protein n=1 Tax=Ktedonobacter sp. SOSP1-85 TaxID=2778367 RepID=UPI0019160910|nr:hypothetical protein [Ktedonobacter sp. SOSP1-85]